MSKITGSATPTVGGAWRWTIYENGHEIREGVMGSKAGAEHMVSVWVEELGGQQ